MGHPKVNMSAPLESYTSPLQLWATRREKLFTGQSEALFYAMSDRGCS
jgi:hypothetical protein